ncbi:MAG: alpha/beta hydrolase [Rhodobacteraceae bacterium]|nr:alpha/beta hydrolase [Paracoccaceae bacterium]
MTYHARIHEGRRGAPLLLALHGTGGNEDQFFDLSRQLLPDATVVSPRGDVSEFGAARFFRRTGEGVYDMADLSRAIDKMAAYLGSFDHNGPIYAFGYSNGANILAALIIENPELVERAGLLHPLIPWNPAPVDLVGKDVLITAGQNDPITPWAESQRLQQWFEDQGARVQGHVHAGGHELRPEEVTALHDLLTGQVAG